MKLLISKISLLIISFLTFFIFSSFQKVNASPLVFSDNFDDGNANSWIVTRNTCYYGGSAARWEVVGGKLGIKIAGSTCSTEIMPDDALWGSIGNNYVVEFDMQITQGSDHNFAFRYTDPSSWYGIHLQSPNKLTLERVYNTDRYSNEVIGDFSTGQTVHFKIEVNDEHIKIYKGSPPQLILDYPDAGGRFRTGRIALRASVGADPTSETWFDNVVVTSLDEETEPSLNVPVYKQTNPLWENDVYDFANVWSPAHPEISTWGCALTSAVMVFRYHGLTKLPDGTDLNPGSLNTWMKNQEDGYIRGGLVNWIALSRLSKLAKSANPAILFDALKVKIGYGENKPQLTTNLTNNLPAVLEVPGHFIVATGVSGSTYNINDPYFDDRTTLTSYNDTFRTLIGYEPTNTDLSYLMFIVDSSVNLSLTDSMGNPVGDSFIQNTLISNFDHVTTSGSPFRIFYLPEPSGGNYQLRVTSTTPSYYALDAYLYDQGGSNTLSHFTGVVGSGNEDIFNLQFNKQTVSSSQTAQSFTLNALRADLNLFYTLNLINNQRVYNNLLAKVDTALKYNTSSKRIVKSTLQKLLSDIKTQRGKFVSENAYNSLTTEINTLINSL